MSDIRTELLEKFVHWANAHITGDEKGQAQIFLDRLFIAFGHPGSLDVGGEPEFRIRKASQDGGGTSFADYVWKPIVLIEMKRRGEKLSRHYRQAFDYWTRLVPDRPRYVVLCNFDEFEVYDFETQMDTPVGRVALADLSSAYGPLAFLFPGHPAPIFSDHREGVTREAAAKLAKCFNKLIKRDVPRPLAQRFILQMLVALFAEDIGLLEKYFVTRLLNEAVDDTVFDLLDGLFKAMNRADGSRGGRFRGVPYFNGGLFSESAAIELTGPEIVLLRDCAASDWSKVQPEIFGTVFEQTLDKDERHAQGAHFTHPADIMKIIGPTIVDPWRGQIEAAKTAKRLGELLYRIQHFHVLDPACGSGNFLYMAYREMKRLEARIYEKIEGFSSKAERGQMRISYLSAQNFHGMDINPFAVELAKVTMMLARKLAIDELHITEPALPLDNLDAQFRCTDALIRSEPAGLSGEQRNWRKPILMEGLPVIVPWPKADVIIGNPPFNGSKKLKPDLGPEYVNALRSAYPEMPGMADFCVFWIYRANRSLSECTRSDPVIGRAGLVGTQNIRNNASRVGGLDQVVLKGSIVEAVDNQPWSGEANVHVSIANWAKTQNPQLLPAKRRLWSKLESNDGRQRKRRAGKLAAKEYELTFREVDFINSALSDHTDVSAAAKLEYPNSSYVVSQGVTPGADGFVLTSDEDCERIWNDTESRDVLFPYLIGRELLVGAGNPERAIIDFGKMGILDARRREAAFAHVREYVLPEIQRKAEEEHESENAHADHLEKWWLHWRARRELVERIAQIPRYLVCSRVTKRPIFVFAHQSIRPGDALQCFAFEDDYSFGILQSDVHWAWFIEKCSKLKSDFRYTPESVFGTFAWPQEATTRKVLAVAEAGRAIRKVREQSLANIDGGLRELYRTLELPGANPLRDAHEALNEAVLNAYGFSVRKDVLLQLLELNRYVADRIERNESIVSPGVPASFKNRADLLTEDCVRPVGLLARAR